MYIYLYIHRSIGTYIDLPALWGGRIQTTWYQVSLFHSRSTSEALTTAALAHSASAVSLILYKYRRTPGRIPTARWSPHLPDPAEVLKDRLTHRIPSQSCSRPSVMVPVDESGLHATDQVMVLHPHGANLICQPRCGLQPGHSE